MCYQFLRLNVKQTNRKFPCHRTVVIIAIAVRIWSIEKTRRPGRVFASFVSVCGVWTREFFSAHMKACERWQYDILRQDQETVPFLYFCPLDWVLLPTEGFAPNWHPRLGPPRYWRCSQWHSTLQGASKWREFFTRENTFLTVLFGKNWLHSLYC